MRFLLVMPVWGEKHTELFLKFCVPSLLFDNNLPALVAHGHEVILQIFTFSDNADRIKGDAALTRLSITVDEVSFGYFGPSIEARPSFSPYHLMGAAHKAAIEKAAALDAALIFFHPDMVASNKLLETAMLKISAGSRAVLCHSVRLCKEKFQAKLIGGNLKIAVYDTRDMVSIALDTLHPMSDAYFADTPFSFTWPIDAFFPFPDRSGFIARSYGLHPLVIWPEPKLKWQSFKSSYDNDYLEQVCPDLNKVSVICDTDHGACCELSDFEYKCANGRFIDGTLGAAKDASLLASLDGHSTRQFFQRNSVIFWHTRDIKYSEVEAPLELSNNYVQAFQAFQERSKAGHPPPM